MEWINRICKRDGTPYHDPGGDPDDPTRRCPACGGRAWEPPEQTEGSGREHPVGAVEIAATLGVSSATVYQWHQRGLLPVPHWQVDGNPAWREDDVIEWVYDDAPDGIWRRPRLRSHRPLRLAVAA